MSETKRALALVATILAGCFAMACGGTPPATETTETTTTPPAETQPPAEPQPPADMAFRDMTKEQKAEFMKNSVVPTMKMTFQQFDAKKFGEFNCKTCHGTGATDGTFKMPSPDLPPLPAPDKFAELAKDPEHAPWVEFMATKVKPQMATLLKIPEYDPATNSGEFGCYACHTQAGAK